MEILLPCGYTTLVDSRDAKWLELFPWRSIKNHNTRYVKFNPFKNSNHVQLHRVIADAPDGVYVDHINGDGLDNRRENLRLCSNAQNQHNARLSKMNTSGVKNVCWHRGIGRWYATLRKNGKVVWQETFTDLQEAANAVALARVALHGSFSNDGRFK